MCVLVCVCLMGALFVVAGVMVYGVSRVCLRLCVVSVCACCLCVCDCACNIFMCLCVTRVMYCVVLYVLL